MTERRIAITGGFGRLGDAVARAAVADGWRVARIDRSPAPHSPVEGAVDFGGVDLTDPEQAARAMEGVREALGGLDALANVAGGFTWETMAGGSLETWDRLYAMNTRTCAAACMAALPLLKASAAGRIVNVGANGALKAATGMGAYAASKAGVHALTQALAEELKGSVTVNAVLPSILDTPQNRADMPDVDPGLWVAPERLAKVILWLASEEAGEVTGALLPVTGRV